MNCLNLLVLCVFAKIFKTLVHRPLNDRKLPFIGLDSNLSCSSFKNRSGDEQHTLVILEGVETKLRNAAKGAGLVTRRSLYKS